MSRSLAWSPVFCITSAGALWFHYLSVLCRSCILLWWCRAYSRGLQDSGVSVHWCHWLWELCLPSSRWRSSWCIRLGVLLQETAIAARRSQTSRRAFQVNHFSISFNHTKRHQSFVHYALSRYLSI